MYVKPFPFDPFHGQINERVKLKSRQTSTGDREWARKEGRQGGTERDLQGGGSRLAFISLRSFLRPSKPVLQSRTYLTFRTTDHVLRIAQKIVITKI